MTMAVAIGLVAVVLIGLVFVAALVFVVLVCFVVGVVLHRQRGLQAFTAKDAVQVGAESVSKVFRRTSNGLEAIDTPPPPPLLDDADQLDAVPAEPMGLAEPLDATTAGRLGQALRHAALQRTVEGLSRVVCDHARDLVQGDRVDCLFFDQSQQVLWRANSAVDLPLEGLAGSVAAKGRPLLASHAGSDPHYSPEIDDPTGTGNETLLLAPVLDGQHHVHAVLVIVRERRPFSRAEQQLFLLFAQRISIVFESVHLESLRTAQMQEAIRSQADDLFDPGALAAHREGKFGEVVEFPRLLPPIAYAAVAVAMFGLFGVASIARLNRYASGPALVTSPSAVNIASPTAAILEHIDVAAGDVVRAGQAVAHLNADVERSEVQRAMQDFEQRLVRRLADPADSALEAEVADARVVLQRAKGRVAERVLTAPRDGVVDDIRLVAGQPIEAGQTVVSLGPADGQLRLVCAIPANHRPALEVGQVLRFEPVGYPFSFQRVTVTAIGNRVFGPSELRAVFGREVGDTLDVKGPVVVVEATMAGRSFTFDGVDYGFHPGMLGTADIRVADEPALFAMLPFLKGVLGRG